MLLIVEDLIYQFGIKNNMSHVIIFYLFASITIFSGVMVIALRNPVHSVLFLILAFFNTAGLFIMLGAEFLAMILVIVYVGAVAVLFMFIVMMLDINFVEMRQGFLQYLPIGGLIGLVLLIELVTMVGYSFSNDLLISETVNSIKAEALPNAQALGEVLYTKYVFLFQSAGMILLVAMIGAIVLTHRKRPGVKKQNISDQISRDAKRTVKLKKVEIGRGI